MPEVSAAAPSHPAPPSHPSPAANAGRPRSDHRGRGETAHTGVCVAVEMYWWSAGLGSEGQDAGVVGEELSDVLADGVGDGAGDVPVG
jgi:hypothetical protein